MKKYIVVFAVLVLLFGCAQQDVQPEPNDTKVEEIEEEKEVAPPPQQPEDKGKLEYPWGTDLDNVSKLHLKYYYVDQDALFELIDNPNMNFDTATKGKTGVVEAWYDREEPALRVDVYNEKTESDVCSFDSLDYNGKTYMIKRQEIFKGRKESSGYVFSDYYEKEYKWNNCQVFDPNVDERMVDLPNINGFMLATYIYEPMYASPLVYINPKYAISDAELIVPSDPKHSNTEVKEIIKEGFGENKTIAGRNSSKWSYPFMFYIHNLRGYVYVDKELGIALQEYVTNITSDDLVVEKNYAEPKLIYDTIAIEEYSDAVFSLDE